MENHQFIHHFLENSAAHYPEKIALIHEEMRICYADLNVQANSLAHWLADSGVEPGDRVVILLTNGPEYVVSYYGILKAGAVAVPVSTDIRPEGLMSILRELEAKVLISSNRFERMLLTSGLSSADIRMLLFVNPRMKWSASGLSVSVWDEVVQGANAAPNLKDGVTSSSLASIIYTSGSTGKPKGVMLSHINIVSNVNSICQYLKLTSKDIQMVVLPFFYVMGKSLLNTHVAVGGTLIINNRFAFPAAVIKQMADEGVTAFSGVPSTYAHLLHRSPLAAYRDRLTTLRYCSQAGGHMPHRLKLKLKQTLPDHTDIFIMYGATEAGARLSYLPPDQVGTRINSIGKAIPGVELKIVGPGGEELGINQKGEIVGQGPNIMMGYWKSPEDSKKVLSSLGYHTGDIGYRDVDGYFFITGRRDNLIKVGGHRINTLEVEDIIIESDKVSEVVVIGVPDSLLGNRLTAFAVAKTNDYQEAELHRFCHQHLPSYKVPAEIHFVRSLPLKANGKVDKTKCLSLLNKQFQKNESS